MELKNKTILITGGTSGIGYELGKSLLKMNNRVILLGRDKTKLNDAKEQGFDTIACGLSSQSDIENAVVTVQNQFSDISVLFNNAGVQYNYLFGEAAGPFKKIRSEIEINLTGQLILTQLLIPLLGTSSDALIVNTTSGLGAFPKADGLVYSASKAAMRNFTIGLRYALKGTGIHVIEFIPPVTDTGMTSARDEKKMSPEKLVASIIPQIEKNRHIVTVPAMRVFLWIAWWLPGLANKMLSKK